jgi:hypothetical protein
VRVILVKLKHVISISSLEASQGTYRPEVVHQNIEDTEQ